MKTIFLLLLFFCNSLQAQIVSTDTSTTTPLDYIASNTNDLLDENGNRIFNFSEQDSIVFNGETINNSFGFSVSTAGDVNGDGYSDVIIGAMGYSSNMGRAYIFYGGSSMNNIADVTMTGEATNNKFGLSVSSAGDLNGDGYSDVIVGARNFNSFTGRVYIFYGGSSMNNVADIILTGETTSNYFGESVSTAGDVNDDGFDDVIIGASEYSSMKGRAYIYYGGLNMNSVVDVIMTGESNSNFFGCSVSTAGDVNGDSFSDVIIGARGFNVNTGKIYIYYGGLNMNSIVDLFITGETENDQFGGAVSEAGDVNDDGFYDVLIGAEGYNENTGKAYIYYGGLSMNNIADVSMTGESTYNSFARSISTVRDLNNDGFDDVIIGASGYSENKGKVYIYYGGLNMDNIADVILVGEDLDGRFGTSVSNAKDINDDGNLDVIVGGNGFNSLTGRSYLYINLIPKPDLVNPNNNSINNLLSINFKWKKINSSELYVLIVSTDSVFNNLVVNDTISIDTFKTVSGFQKDKKYFWRVRSKDTSGIIFNSLVWNFTTIPPIYLNLKVLMEGMYYQFFNQMIRKDTVNVYLRNITSPYAVVDSAKGIIDSLSFSNIFSFINALSGTYYIVVKHFNSIETWSKAGGESMTIDGTIYSYDFTTSASKAYGNNQKLKGSKYCIYGGNVNGDAIVDGSDLSEVDNDSYTGLTGRFLRSDVNGDNIVDAGDVSLVDNNSYNSILRITP